MNSPNRPNKGQDKHFAETVSGLSVLINVGLMPGQTICPGIGAADSPQKIFFS
jgi:hypothetical protein